MAISIERIYESQRGPGFRVLVDRLWPRGLRKDQVEVDLWLREVSPSDSLRLWFAHDPAKWTDFKRRYFKELASKTGWLERLVDQAESRPIVLLYGAKDRERNQAAALKEYLEKAVLKGRAAAR